MNSVLGGRTRQISREESHQVSQESCHPQGSVGVLAGEAPHSAHAQVLWRSAACSSTLGARVEEVAVAHYTTSVPHTEFPGYLPHTHAL